MEGIKMEYSLYEVVGDRIQKTEFSPSYFGGHRTFTVGINTLRGKEWMKEKEQAELDSFYACHTAD